MNFIFEWQKQNFTHSLRLFVKYFFATRKYNSHLRATSPGSLSNLITSTKTNHEPMSRCFQKSKGALPRQQLMYMAIFYNRHLAVDCKTGEIVFETQFSKYANKTCAESFVYFKQIIKLIRSLFLLKCSNYRDTVMEDNGYSVKDRSFIFNIVYRSLLFRSSFCFIFLLSRGDDVDDGCCP